MLPILPTCSRTTFLWEAGGKFGELVGTLLEVFGKSWIRSWEVWGTFVKATLEDLRD